MIFQLMCFLVAVMGLAVWVVGVQVMIHCCHDLETLGLRGKRLAGFSAGALMTVLGFALVLYSAATAIHMANGELDAWLVAMGVR